MSNIADSARKDPREDDRLERQARAAAKSARDAAIKRAEAELVMIKPGIVGHIKHECLRLEGALLAARAHHGDYRSCVSEAYRAGQNLRDVSEPMGFPLIGFVATNLCTIVETADEAAMDYPVAVLDCYLDALQLVQTPPYQTKQLKEIPELTAALLRAVQYTKVLAARAAKPRGAVS